MVATTPTWPRPEHVSEPNIYHKSKLENHVSHMGVVLGEEVDERPGFFDS